MPPVGRKYLPLIPSVSFPHGNRKQKSNDPPIAVRIGRGGSAAYVRDIDILDENGKAVARVTSSEPPLSCGASIFIVCEHGAKEVPEQTITTNEIETSEPVLGEPRQEQG